MCFLFFNVHISEAAISPENDIGFTKYDAWFDVFPSHAWCYSSYDYPANCEIDLDIYQSSTLLEDYGIDVTISQPDFEVCYPVNSQIPVAITASYTLCANTPVECTPEIDPVTKRLIPCASYDASSDYLNMYASAGPNWYNYSGRDWEFLESEGVWEEPCGSNLW